MKYQSIIEKMSLFEKAQMMTGKSTWQTKDFEKYDIPSIFLSDGPHGIRKQLGSADHLGLNESIPATCFPTAATVANSWDTKLALEIGQALGTEARELGVNVVLGPGMNIKRNPLCGRNFEYFSEDPLLTGMLANSYVKGIQSRGVAACPKHFAANSQELRRMSNDSIVDERTLREIYLSAFEYVVTEAHPKFMMTAYNQLNGEYTNEHHHLLQEILYGEWQYNSVIVTDWGGSNDHIKGIVEGSHLEMPGTGVPGAIEVEEAVLSGKLDEALLDKRIDELLDVILTLTTERLEARDSLTAETSINHHQLAYRAAQESIVLLKNSQNILPLSIDKTLAFIGDFVKTPRYQGAGSSVVNPTKLETIADLLEEYDLSNVIYAQGFNRLGQVDEQLLNQAVEAAKQVDIPVIFMGLTEITESEGMDRTTMELSADQLQLVDQVVSVNPNTVIVLSGGSVVEMPFANRVAGIVHTYLGGQAGAHAILDVLMGHVNPSGKLAETYPITYKDVPSASYYPGVEKTSEYREGIFVGYRYFNSGNKEVLYPFGYGLSYTQFEYKNVDYSSNVVKLIVENTGTLAGSEIVQVYIEHESTNTFYAKQQLAGFKKVFVEPGQSTEVSIEISDRAFQYYNVKTQKWEIDGGNYVIAVGAHSRDIRHRVSLVFDATTDVLPYVLEKVPHYFAGKVSQINTDEFEALLGKSVPESNWNTQMPLSENDTLSQMYYAKGWMARLGYKTLTHFLERSIQKGKPNLNLYFNYNMTFRAMQKMMGGMINHEMVDHVLTMVNGRFIVGAGRLIKAYFKNKKVMKERQG